MLDMRVMYKEARSQLTLDEILQRIRNSEGDHITLKIDAANETKSTSIKATISNPGMFGQDRRGHVMAIVTNKKPDFFLGNKIGSKVHQPFIPVECRISIQNNTAGIQSELSCIQMLTQEGGDMDNRRKVILNKNATNVVVNHLSQKFTHISRAEIEKHLEYVSNHITDDDVKKLSPEQKAALRSALELPNDVGILEGLPGCGKTFVLALIVCLYLLCRLDVLCLAPPHAAVDNMADVFMYWIKRVPMLSHIIPTRIYRSKAERKDFFGKDTEEEEDGNAEFGDAADNDNEERLSRDEQLIIEATVAFMKNQEEKDLRNPHISLHRQVFANAEKKYKEGKSFDYCAPATVTTYWDDEAKQVSLQSEQGEKRDLFKEIVEGKELLLTTPMDDWDPEMKTSFLSATRVLIKDWMKGYQGQQLVFCTPSAAAGDDVRPNIGEHGEGLAIVGDEWTKNPHTLAFVGFRCQYYRKIVATIFAGDHEQLSNIVVTATLKQKINEFASAHAHNMMTRLKNQGYPTIPLNESFRYHYEISRFPSKYTYGCKLRCHPITSKFMLSDAENTYARVFTEHREPNKSYQNVCVNVVNSEQLYDPPTKSRYNLEHA